MKTVFSVLLIFFSISSLRASSLSGSYTIDPSGTGYKNYSSFTNAVKALKDSGVSGAVIFNVANGSYKEKVTVPAITGASTANTITFQSKSTDSSRVILYNNAAQGTYNVPGFALHLKNASFINFRGITLKNASKLSTSSYYDFVLVLDEGSHNNTFSNCQFIGIYDKTNFNYSAVVKGAEALNGNASVDSFNTFTNNLLSRGWEGFLFGGAYQNSEPGNAFIHNSIDSVYVGFYLQDFGAITISDNKVHIPWGGKGIFMSNFSNPSSGISYVMNNFLSIGGKLAFACSGIVGSDVDSTKIVNNNINLYGTANTTTYGIYLYNSIKTGCEVLNNIIINKNSSSTDYGMSIHNIHGEGHNDIISNGKYPVEFYAADYGDVASYKAAVSGSGLGMGDTVLNPYFVSDTNLHISNTQLRGTGIPLPYDSMDIDGDKRSTTIPYMGADEYFPPAIFPQVTSIVNPLAGYCGGTQDVYIQLSNQGATTLTSATIEWTVNDTVETSYSWTGSLASGASTSVKVGAYVFSTDKKLNYIKSYPSSGNGISLGSTVKNTTLYKFYAGIKAGTYTINKNGSGDYKSFRMAVSDLNHKGVCGAVTFEAANGTYKESFEIDSFPGASLLNTVTFQSKSKDSTKVIIDTLNESGSSNTPGYTVNINGAAFVKFKGICFRNIVKSSNSYGNILQISGAAHDITLSNCYFRTNVNSASVFNYGKGIINDPYPGEKNILIQNNHISGGMSGIYLQSLYGVPQKGNIITGNIIDSSYNKAVYISGQDNFNFSGNIIKNAPASYGLYIFNSGINDTCHVKNNFISLVSDYSAFYLFSSNLCNVYNNSFYSEGSGSSSFTCQIQQSPFSSSNTNLINNILYNNGKGAALNLIPSGGNINADYNDYFTNGDFIASNKFLASRTLADWKHATSLDSNSVSIDPVFKNSSKGNLHINPHSKVIAYGGKVLPGINEDIDQQPRKKLFSIGADEIPVSKIDASVYSIDSISGYSCGSKSRSVWITLMNAGSDTLKSVNIKWSVNGSARTDITWIGILAMGQKTSLKLDTVGFISGHFYRINVFSENPDSSKDENTANDSAIMVCGTGATGNYTIGGISPDFKTFRSAVTALKIVGVCGATTFNVRDGDYKECITIDSITGSSALNTITFQAQSLDSSTVSLDTASGSPSYYTPAYTLRFNGCRDITFRKMTIFNSLTSSQSNYYGDVIYITNGATNITIENNRLLSNYSGKIGNSGTIIDDDGNTVDNFITIKNNFIRGAAIGIRLNASARFGENGNIISHNYITSFTGYGIYIIKQDSFLVEKNTIISSNSGAGLYIDNTINNLTGSDTSIVRNNFISLSNSASGIYSTDNDMLGIYNNSVYINSSSASAILLFNSAFGTSVNVFNNIFYNAGKGPAITSNPEGVSSSNYNNFYTAGTYFGTFDFLPYNKITDWYSSSGLDLKSCLGKADFVSASTGDLHLTSKSVLDIRNAKSLASVPDDIDGEKRTVVPCIGADETPLVGNDANLMSIDSPALGFCVGTRMVYISVRNTGNNTISSVQVNWGINGVARTSLSWTGTLKSGDKIQLKLDTVSFPLGKIIDIYATTSSPNGVADSFPGNDSTLFSSAASVSGTFTIGGSSPDFNTLRDAVNLLKKAGVCGPVVFNMRDGKYNETMYLTKIRGASSINTITFQSQSLDSSRVSIDSTWSVANSPELILMNNASWFIFKDITMTYHASGGIGVELIYMFNASDNNFFINNRIVGTGINGDAFFLEGCNNNRILNNVINKISNGVYMGVYGSIPVNGNIIRGNAISNFTYGIYSSGADNFDVEYNRFNSDGYGIYLDATMNTLLRDSFVIANNFMSCASENCIFAYTDHTSVRNNSLYSNSNSQPLYFYNSILGSCDVSNNIVQNTGNGGAAYLGGHEIISDHNDFISSGSILITSDSFGNISDLKSWKSSSGMDAHSISVDPKFTNAKNGDLHIKSTSSGVARKGFYFTAYPFDIDHQRRPFKACDIGADQFTFENNDVGVINILYPALKRCVDSINSVPVEITNYGLNSESGFNIHISVTGADTATASYKFANSIAKGMDTTVIITLPHKLNTTSTGGYRFTAYTDLANDTDRTSDTFRTNFNFRDGMQTRETFRSPSCAGDITFFYDSSRGTVKSYLWNFGDGFTSSKKNPIHAFIHPGKHVVSLMIKNASGCTDSSAKVVDVDTADARFTYSFKGTSVDFTPNISGMKLYSWDYDDGSSGDSIEKPVHTFPTSNKYRVTLRVSTQAGCKATWSDSVSAVYTASLSEVKGNMSLTVYPNPFKETANIRYSLDQAADIKIEIFALDGKRLANLVNTRQEPGNYTLQFTPSEYNISAAGLFIIRMSVNESVLRKTIIMVH